MKHRIYVADDETNIREAIKTFLENDGYIVTAFENGDLLLEEFKKTTCDLIILDIMMPGSNGFTICTEIRKMSTVPIIMLTARDSDLDYATGLSIGSDDYITKPFSAMSLMMRVKAMFRRIEFERKSSTAVQSDEIIRFGDISLDKRVKTAVCRNSPLELTPNEYNLLHYLLENNDKAVSRDEILNQVWGFDSDIETRAADDTVRRLRKKISESCVIIDTVWGFGFRLKVREGRE